MEKLKCVLCKPNKNAEITEIENTLGAIQGIVDGYIELCTPFYENVVIVCNERSKFNGMEPSRAIYMHNTLIDVIYGPMLIVGISGEEFVSLTDEQLEKYLKIFEEPLITSVL